MQNKRVISNLLLLLTAFIWGIAFVAQSVGMDYVGPWTFVFSRFLISAIALLPVTVILQKKAEQERPADAAPTPFKTYLLGGCACGTLLGLASISQQVGIQYTTAGKAGFITALYVGMVPVLGIFLGRRPGKRLWFSVILSIAGLYLISIHEGFVMEVGDVLMVLCALLFSFQIMSVDHFSPLVENTVVLANIQFCFSAMVGLVGMLLFEKPDLAGLKAAALPILYAGACSGSIAYTLQITAQRNTDPAVASLIMSLEAVFSALAGWVILHQSLSLRELLGCSLVFLAVVLAQLPHMEPKQAR